MNKNLKNFAIIIISSLLISGCTSKKSLPTNMTLDNIPTNIPSDVSPSVSPIPQTDPIVSLKTKNGEILIKLYQDKCPKTVANFLMVNNIRNRSFII